MFMLDTDICSYILKAHPKAVLAKFKSLDPDETAVCEIVAADLYCGADKAGAARAQANRVGIDDLLSRLQVSCPGRAGTPARRFDINLASHGTPIGNMDLLIAAHALTLGAMLVTNNVAEFQRVPGLALENWTWRRRCAEHRMRGPTRTRPAETAGSTARSIAPQLTSQLAAVLLNRRAASSTSSTGSPKTPPSWVDMPASGACA